MANGKYQLLKPLRPEQYAALRADIEARGVKVPVEVDDEGNVLDGHNRVEIADALGKPYKTIVRKFKTDEEKKEHVLKLNIARRHLDPLQWGMAFDLLLAVRGVRRGGGGDHKSQDRDQSATIALCSEEVGVPERTAKHRLAMADAYEALPKKERDAVDTDKKTLKEAKRDVKKTKREADRKKRAVEAKKATRDGDYGVHAGRFQDLQHLVDPESVDLIFTDPPYDRKSIGCYADLAAYAVGKLKPGGSLMCYAGQYVLDEILDSMVGSLRLWWVCACQHTGALARMREYGIVVNWKPILWFVRDTRGDKHTFVDDLVKSDPPAKIDHDWQQSITEAAYYIERLTEPGGLVVDPFCGSGTSAVAAAQLDRRWLAFDDKDDVAALARKRVKDAVDAKS